MSYRQKVREVFLDHPGEWLEADYIKMILGHVKGNDTIHACLRTLCDLHFLDDDRTQKPTRYRLHQAEPLELLNVWPIPIPSGTPRMVEGFLRHSEAAQTIAFAIGVQSSFSGLESV